MRTIVLASTLVLLAFGGASALAETPRTLLAQEREAARELPRADAAEPRDEAPIPDKLPPRFSEDSDSPVRIRVDEQTGDRIEEYYTNGRLHMVKVTPRRGPPYYLLDTNGDGRLDSKDGEGNVRPVYWVLYRWN